MNTSEMIQALREMQSALDSQEEMRRTNVLLGSEIRGLKEELDRRERTIADNQQMIELQRTEIEDLRRRVEKRRISTDAVYKELQRTWGVVVQRDEEAVLQRTEIEGLRKELQERATQTEGLNVSLAANIQRHPHSRASDLYASGAGQQLCLGRKLYQHAVCLTTPKKAKK